VKTVILKSISHPKFKQGISML